MRTTPPLQPRLQRLGPHHFAHLRAIAEGIGLIDSARRYLGIEHGHEALTVHRQTVDLVRAIARRQRQSAWRLVGILIQAPPSDDRPSLAEFVAQRSLEDWREDEQIAFYDAEFADTFLPQGLRSKTRRREGLRQRQLQLLRELEAHHAERPQTDHMISGWFDERTADKLLHAGYVNLGELHQAIAMGGRWYSTLPGIGRTKAQRIANHLCTLLPGFQRLTLPLAHFPALEGLQAHPTPQVHLPLATLNSSAHSAIQEPGLKGPDGQYGGQHFTKSSSGAPQESLLNASNDLEAVRIWVQSHAGSAATVKSFWREARIFLLWLQTERQGLRFAALKVDDCLAFKAFIENIPPHWICRNRIKPGQPGWAPFRGPLSESSRHHLLNIVGSMFSYLKLANYIQHNPWPLIKTRVAMKKTASNQLDTRAFSAQSQTQITAFIATCPSSASQARMLFIGSFLASVGLRASELLAARLADLRHTPHGYALEVIGKGDKRRVVAVPPDAMRALNVYLQSRGWQDFEETPADAPLLSSVKDSMASITYQALYLTVRSWLGKAIEQAAIPESEKRSLRGASSHWFRHTFATRSIEREVPIEVVQAQLGHTSITTTMNIYAKASLDRQLQTLSAAFCK